MLYFRNCHTALLFSVLLSPQSPPSPTKTDQRIPFHTSLISLQTKLPHTFYDSVPLTFLQFATFSPTARQCWEPTREQEKGLRER